MIQVLGDQVVGVEDHLLISLWQLIAPLSS